MNEVKSVGTRRGPLSPSESVTEVLRLQRVAAKIARHPRPRGMVFKARPWEEMELFEKRMRRA